TFHLLYRFMNQTEGRAACRENHIDLITVYSDGDNADLYNMTQKAGSNYGWIGLIRGQFSEKWSNGDPVTFRSLAGVCGTSICCAVMKPDGLWESLQCTETKYFMCYKKGDTEPRQNYHLIPENKTWYGAQRYCRSKYTDLVSIRDQQQNEEVKMIVLNSNTPFWIGLLCDDWQWTDGGNSTYRNWRIGEPKSSPGDCVSLWPGGQWYSMPCSNKYLFTLCDSDTEPLQNYHLIPENKTWYGAQRYCRSKYTDLVSIRDQQQNEEVKMEGLNSTTPFWIGLLCDDWQWTDGGNSTYRNW
ncbi:secretory phospholipase A2 receptor, partial [Silurus asotus]